MVGILGNIRFRVSSHRVLTFQNMKREISTTWNMLDRISQKPLVEYGGADLQKISLEITLDASLGVRPKGMLRTLEQMTESSKAYDLVLGRTWIGNIQWVITSVPRLMILCCVVEKSTKQPLVCPDGICVR